MMGMKLSFIGIEYSVRAIFFNLIALMDKRIVYNILDILYKYLFQIMVGPDIYQVKGYHNYFKYNSVGDCV